MTLKCWIFPDAEFSDFWGPGWGETRNEAWDDAESRATAPVNSHGYVYSLSEGQRVEAFDKYAVARYVPPWAWIAADLGHTCRDCERMLYPQAETPFITSAGDVLCGSCAGERFGGEREGVCTLDIFLELTELRSRKTVRSTS